MEEDGDLAVYSEDGEARRLHQSNPRLASWLLRRETPIRLSGLRVMTRKREEIRSKERKEHQS